MGNLTNKQKSTMFRFVALFALVAVAFAEPEADSQFVYMGENVAGVPVHGVYNTYAGHVVSPVVKPVVTYNAAVPVVKPVVPAVPVVKYVNPHHTEGMTKEGVPEKTDSVKIAEKQHEYAQAVEKVKNVHYVDPYTTYAGFPYVHHPVAAHVVAKREADSEADPAVFYNAYGPATHMLLPPTLTIHTPPLLLDTHTTRLLLESQPTPLDTPTQLHTLTATEAHTPTVPTHTEMSTDGIEPL